MLNSTSKKKLKEGARMFLAKKKPLFVHENRRFRLREPIRYNSQKFPELSTERDCRQDWGVIER